MIVAQEKPLDQIRRMIDRYPRVLIVGCGTCMTVCGAGGEREVSYLHEALRLAETRGGNGAHAFSEYTVKRQCDPEFIELLADRVSDVDAVLSLGCGIGVQAIAERFPEIPVLPGVNTSFMGMAREQGVWDERCAACGDCRLEDTAGICPITRCTKGILNGPCRHQERQMRGKQGHGLRLGPHLPAAGGTGATGEDAALLPAEELPHHRPTETDSH